MGATESNRGEGGIDDRGVGENEYPLTTPATTPMVIKPYLLALSPTSLTEIADNNIKPLFQKLVGSPIHLEICTCPDIACAAMALGQFNINPTCAHLAAVRR